MDITECSIRSQSHSCGNKIEVSSKSITLISNSIVLTNTSSIKYSIHKIKDKGYQLAKIKYYPYKSPPGTPRERVIAYSGLTFPIPEPVSIYTFYCKKSPALIYVEANTKYTISGWYKKGIKDSDPWDQTTKDLMDVTPDNAGECDKFSKLIKVLRGLECSNLTDCSEYPGSQPFSSILSVSPQTQDPQVTIKLLQKPINVGGETQYPGSSTGGGIPTIKVTLTSYPNPNISDFYKYEHTLDTKKQFKLLTVIDNGKEISVIAGSGMDKITSVSAYYWKHNKGRTGKPDNTLLLEVVQDGSKYSYYGNSRNNGWSVYLNNLGQPLEQAKLVNKLTLLNCEINDVVMIDVGERGVYDACDEKEKSSLYPQHTNDKIIVTKDVNSTKKLINYQVYTHRLQNPYAKPFHMVGFKDSYRKAFSGISLPPILNVKGVKVYMCGDRSLMLYIDSNDPNISDKKWWRYNSDKSWKEVSSKDDPPYSKEDYEKILTVLDEIKSACAPPSATIDISKRANGGYYYGPNSLGRMIWIEKTEGASKKGNPPSHYTRYDHQVVGREDSYFTLQQVNYGSEETNNIPGTYKVTKVSVYYWTSLEQDSNWKSKSRPLLIKIVTKDSGEPSMETYYENTGDKGDLNWQSTTITPGDLQKKLHLLNCRLNHAVIIDVSQNNTPGHYDACEKDEKLDSGHGDRMRVTKDTPDDKSLGKYDVYKHALNSGGNKFHVVSFVNGDANPINIGGTLPILDVSEVRVYFCSQDKPKKPLLIYYHISNGGTPEHYWYRNNSPDNSAGKWEHADLSSTDDSSEVNHEKILQVLDSLPSDCNPTSSATVDATASQGLAPDFQTPAPRPPEKPEEKTEEPPKEGTTSAFGAGYFFATSAGSAATFFGGWKLYNRYKGDPWVRQI